MVPQARFAPIASYRGVLVILSERHLLSLFRGINVGMY